MVILHKIVNKNRQIQSAKEYRGHIATVLLQDYFHRGVFKPIIGEKQWDRFEGRLDKNIDDTLVLFDRYNVKATFFTLGWIGDRNPEIIKRIASEGHEIASAGFWARGVREMTPKQFREDLRRSCRALESAGANKIIGYRSAYQWFQKKDLWALDILADEGFLYDASCRPAFLRGIKQSTPKYAYEFKAKSRKIWEFPTSTQSISILNLPIAGGSYLRLLPHTFMYRFFNNWLKKTEAPFVLYFHPWELDKQLPKITAIGRLSRIRQYRNLGKMNYILPKYFEAAKFQTISQYLNIPLEYPDTSVLSLQPPTSNLELQASNLESQALDLQPPTSNLIPVTVVIPCYNESSSLPYLAKALNELTIAGQRKYHFKFIFVDDGSTDDTFTKLKKNYDTHKNFIIIQHKKNLGIAAALQTGIREANTDIVCTMDADCSYDPLELLKMIPLIRDNVDMVTASPYHKDGFVLGVPKWRLFLSRSLSRIYHLILTHKLATYTSCFRVCRRQNLLNIKTVFDDYRGIVELLARLDFNGGIIIEYPTTLQCRIFGYSKMRVFNTVVGHLNMLLILIKDRHSSGHY
jgi:polysaccharide deacetylase family protein (PEP-CTERM system associated)